MSPHPIDMLKIIRLVFSLLNRIWLALKTIQPALANILDTILLDMTNITKTLPIQKAIIW